MKSFQWVVFLTALLILNGCGFHLRGDSKILDVYNPLYLEKAGLSAAQYNQAINTLKQAGAQMALSGITANKLQLKMQSLKTRKIADSSLSGVELIQIGTRLEFIVLNSDNQVIVERQVIEQSTEVELDSNNVLSQEGVLNKSRESLEKSLLRGLIFKLSYR